MSEKLTLEPAVDGWMKLMRDGEHIEYVKQVKIAGCELSHEHAGGRLNIECSEWVIKRDTYPALLIEAAEWYMTE